MCNLNKLANCYLVCGGLNLNGSLTSKARPAAHSLQSANPTYIVHSSNNSAIYISAKYTAHKYIHY